MDTKTDHITPAALRARGNKTDHITPAALRARGKKEYRAVKEKLGKEEGRASSMKNWITCWIQG